MPPTTALHPQPLANPAPPIAMGLLLVVALTVLWDMGSGDLAVMRWIGTPQGFPMRSDWLLQAVLHDTLRQACTALWGLLGAWALWPTAWTPHRSPAFALPRSERLWVLALVSASLLAVSLIKLRSQTSCPWDLDLFGGQARHVSHWHWAQAAIVAACRTHGILPVDGPFGDFSDDEGYIAQAKRSATLGMVGKWAIHPKQIALANQVFTPSDEAVGEAREILAAMEQAKANGEGATVYKGRLVDIASIKQAEVIVAQSELIAQNG